MTRPLNGPVPRNRRYGVPRTWRKDFLVALAETSNVTAAAQAAGIDPSAAYKYRKNEPEFARRWLIALCEGYDNLEMELLCRLRAGERRDPDGVEHDNAGAIRLLAQHRANAERGRALREADDEQVTLDSIDALFRGMRERDAANAAILAEDDDAGD